MPESALVGSAVGRIRAHDLDAGSNAEVDYAIVPGDEGNMFDIISDGQTQEGVVVLKKVQSLIIKCTVAAFDTYKSCHVKSTYSRLPWTSFICIMVQWVIYPKNVPRS